MTVVPFCRGIRPKSFHGPLPSLLALTSSSCGRDWPENTCMCKHACSSRRHRRTRVDRTVASASHRPNSSPAAASAARAPRANRGPLEGDADTVVGAICHFVGRWNALLLLRRLWPGCPATTDAASLAQAIQDGKIPSFPTSGGSVSPCYARATPTAGLSPGLGGLV